MKMAKPLIIFCLVLSCLTSVFGADIILNEYNAVDDTLFLNGGSFSSDEDGGRASDAYFGRVSGNGGDWFELVVISDHLDMRNWLLEIYEGGIRDEVLWLSSHSIWSDLRSGTIITISEDVESDISYNPAAGDWWINVQANDNGSSSYIEPSNFPVNNNDWQLLIKDSGGVVRVGPSGEGVSPASGVGNTEIFRLEASPDGSITPNSTDYDDGSDLSTFGAANRWGLQQFDLLRSVVAEPGSLTLSDPNGAEMIKAGEPKAISWETEGTVESVIVEFSTDNGDVWTEVYPANVGNTGNYEWLVPMASSNECLVRVTNAADMNVYDTSDNTFSLYECSVSGDLDGDCFVDFYDFAIMASEWLQGGML